MKYSKENAEKAIDFLVELQEKVENGESLSLSLQQKLVDLAKHAGFVCKDIHFHGSSKTGDLSRTLLELIKE